LGIIEVIWDSAATAVDETPTNNYLNYRLVWINVMIASFINKLENTHIFTEQEAWGLFRIVAISEAIGWTLLIAGILIHKYRLPGHTFSVVLAGQIHGTIFLIYFAMLIAIYSSLGWSRKKFIVAFMAGIPPYGTLIFELWAKRARNSMFMKTYLNTIVLGVMTVNL
jgi:integral membrane protein